MPLPMNCPVWWLISMALNAAMVTPDIAPASVSVSLLTLMIEFVGYFAGACRLAEPTEQIVSTSSLSDFRLHVVRYATIITLSERA